MKAATQQRRTLSFKEGLLEIKKSMGKASGQAPDEPQQAQQDKPARKGPDLQARDGRPKDSRPPRARQPQQQRSGARGQGETVEGDRARRPGQPPKQGRPGGAAGQRPQQQTQQHDQQKQRRRPPRPAPQLDPNLSEADRARIERNRQLNTVWNFFAKHYPAFRDRLPLKIGVAEDLVTRHPDQDRSVIAAVLKRHVNHPRYHERIAAGGPRYELDGSVSAGPGIDPSHIGRANAALARQKAKAEARTAEKQSDRGQTPEQAADKAAGATGDVIAEAQTPVADENAVSAAQSADAGAQAQTETQPQAANGAADAAARGVPEGNPPAMGE